MRRAYSYLRFSRRSQMKGDSLRRQKEYASKLCEKHGWYLDESLTYRDLGVSAFRGKNAKVGALGEFLAAVQSGLVPKGSVLIVESLDRLTRERIRTALGLFTQIIDAGIDIATYEPEEIHTDKSTSDVVGLLIPIIWMSRGHNESSTKSMRGRGVWGEKKRKARDEKKPKTRMTPFWLRVNDAGKFEFIPERVAAVRTIFKLSREGMGYASIVKALEADPERYPPFGRAGGWNVFYVKRILTNPAAFGDHQQFGTDDDGNKVPQGDPILGYYPAAVTEDEFYAAQAGIDSRKGKSGRRGKDGVDANLFTGLVRLALDGSKMCIHRSNKYAYLASNRAAYGHTMKERGFPYAVFERAVLWMLEELKPADFSGSDEKKTDAEADIERLNGETVALDQKLKAFQAAAEDVENGPEETQHYLKLIRTTAQKKEVAQKRLEELKTEVASANPEALGEIQSLVKLLDRVRKSGDRNKIEETCRRLKAKLKFLVEAIWIHVERINHMRRVAHVQLHLRGGQRRYLKVWSPDLASNAQYETLDLKNDDLSKLDLQAAKARRRPARKGA